MRKLLFRFHAAEPGQCGSGFEPEAPVQQLAEHRHHFPHRKGGENGADAESVQMTQKAKATCG